MSDVESILVNEIQLLSDVKSILVNEIQSVSNVKSILVIEIQWVSDVKYILVKEIQWVSDVESILVKESEWLAVWFAGCIDCTLLHGGTLINWYPFLSPCGWTIANLPLSRGMIIAQYVTGIPFRKYARLSESRVG